jgi:menaquinone-dependent protoporphyrinogen oxidase
MSARVLVVYASKYGATREIAEVLGATLDELGARATVVAAGELPEVGDHDVVVVGSAVYNGRWLDAARRFVSTRRGDLERLPTWFFSSGPTGGSPEAEAAVLRSCGLDTPVPRGMSGAARQIGVRGHATFGGTIGEGATGMLARWMPRGDWRDFGQVKEWAGRICNEIGVPVG